jgi:glycine reductase
MHLNMLKYPVKELSWGEETAYHQGKLTINREDLLQHLAEDEERWSVKVSDLALVTPGTSMRVVNIFDVFAARARLGTGAVDYPGLLGRVTTVGSGTTASLEQFTVIATSVVEDKYNKILDMSGVGSELTPYSQMFHLAFQAEPLDPDLKNVDYFKALKRLGLKIGSYLARAAAKSEPVVTTEYTLDPVPSGLSRVVYVCMIASHQRSEADEPILYGDDVSGLLPTILHPNEMLDGAVIAPYWNLGIDTYSFQNNPAVLELYRRHGQEVDFAGVVAYVAHVTREKRARSTAMITNLVTSVIKADLAVVSKLGGGIPESDLLMIIESLEKKGVRTSGFIWSYMGDGTISDSISANSEAADALASVGIYDDWLDLPEQAQVFGGTQVGPFTSNPNDKPVPAHNALRLCYRDICGAISQLGSSRLSMVEI